MTEASSSSEIFHDLPTGPQDSESHISPAQQNPVVWIPGGSPYSLIRSSLIPKSPHTDVLSWSVPSQRPVTFPSNHHIYQQTVPSSSHVFATSPKIPLPVNQHSLIYNGTGNHTIPLNAEMNIAIPGPLPVPSPITSSEQSSNDVVMVSELIHNRNIPLSINASGQYDMYQMMADASIIPRPFPPRYSGTIPVNRILVPKNRPAGFVQYVTVPRNNHRTKVRVGVNFAGLNGQRMPAHIAVNNQNDNVPRKPQKKRQLVENGLSVQNVPQSFVPAKHEALILTSSLSDSAETTTLFGYLKRSDIGAVINVKKERMTIKELEKMHFSYEDQELISKPLPPMMALEWLEIPSASVGQLLSFGHFVEMISTKDLPQSTQKCLFDYDFIMKAVTVPNGDIWPYLALLDVLANAFTDFREEITPEFWVSVMEVERDELLACEYLRQHLASQAKVRGHKIPKQFLPLLLKLKLVDVSELTIAERISILVTIHDYLVHGTFFIGNYCKDLNNEKEKALAALNEIEEAILSKQETKKELEDQIAVLIAKLSETETRSITQEQKTLEDQLLKLSKEIANEEGRSKVFQLTIENVEKNLCTILKTKPLGLDRHHNRYWYFPDMNDGIFVESGWISPLHSYDTQNPLLVHKVHSQGVPLAHLLLLPSPAAPAANGVYTVYRGGVIRACTKNENTYPLLGANKWYLYTFDQIPALSEALNPLGTRERELKKTLEAVNFLRTQRKHPKNGYPSQILEEYFVNLADRLIDNQLLIRNPSSDWKMRLVNGDFQEFRSQILSVFDQIIPSFFVRKFKDETGDWRIAVVQSANWSRIYYLLKVLEVSVRWEKGAEQQECQFCEEQKIEELVRCTKCFDFYHKNLCSLFIDGVCTVCRDASINLDLQEVMDLEPTANSKLGKIQTRQAVNKSQQRKRRHSSENDGSDVSDLDEVRDLPKRVSYGFRATKRVDYSGKDAESDSEEESGKESVDDKSKDSRDSDF